MDKHTVLGSYHSRHGGRLYINLSANAEAGFTQATYLHEACHSWLSGVTPLGLLQNIMEMEACLAEGREPAYARDRAACAAMLTERTRLVQEVFATNIELLILQDRIGPEEMLRALVSMPAQYQQFYAQMMPVHRRAVSGKEKMRHIYHLCTYAMSGTLAPSSSCGVNALAGALSGPHSPKRRLEAALEAYNRTGSPPAQDSEQVFEANIKQMVTLFSRYTKPYFHQAFNAFFSTETGSDEAHLTDLLQQQMLKKVCLFDPAALWPKRAALPPADMPVCLVLKQIKNLISGQNFYLIAHHEGYGSAEISPAELQKRLARCLSVCILFSEYDIRSAQPQFFRPGACLLTVLFQTYAECEGWLQETEKSGALYVGELSLVCTQTDVSLLFFRRREQPQTLFLFPTLTVIRNRLLDAFDLKRHLYSADTPAFLKLFSHLPSELEMLQYFQAVLALLLDRPWKTLIKGGPLSQLAASLGRILGDSALAFKRPDYFKLLAALPQKETQTAPLYVLMRFEGEENTGDTFASGPHHAPLLFPTGESAARFALRYAPGYTGVGVDRFYWPFFRNMVLERGGKAILMEEEHQNLGKLVSVQDVASIWYP